MPNLMEATGCPQVAVVAEVTRGVGGSAAAMTGEAGTATTTTRAAAPSCGVVASDVGVARGNPCAVSIDRAIMSRVSSAVYSLSASMVEAVEAAKVTAAVTAAGTTAGTTAVPTTTTSTGAAGGVRPVQTALAAACVLCGLAVV